MIDSETLLTLSLEIISFVIAELAIIATIEPSWRRFPEIISMYLIWITSPSLPAFVVFLFAYLDLTLPSLHPVANSLASFFLPWSGVLFAVSLVSVSMLVRQTLQVT